MIRQLSIAAVGACIIACTGCASTPAIDINSWEMGVVDVGSANQLVIADAEGRRSAREFVSIEMNKQGRSMGYFQVHDLSGDGLKMEITGRQGELLNYEGDKTKRLFVRADVLEWGAEKETRTSTSSSGSGKNRRTRETKTTIITGTVLLAISLLDENGRALLAEKEYEGVSPANAASKDEAIEAAASNAIADFLADVTPAIRTTRVEFDDSDDKQEVFLKTAVGGNLEKAEADLKGYIDGGNSKMSSVLNLAIIQDALGDYELAIKNYDKALSLGGPERVEDLRAGAARRLRAAEALAEDNETNAAPAPADS